MRRAIDFARRNKILVAVTGLLMAGAGCLGAGQQAARELRDDALKPITVPVQVYKMGIEAASSTEASQRNQMEQSGLQE